MVVQYAIDWDSIYDEWIMRRGDEACNEGVLNELRRLLQLLRRKIETNGLLYLDKRNISCRGLARILSLITEEGSVDKVTAWVRLSEELNQFLRLYKSPEYRVLLTDGMGDDEEVQYETVHVSFNSYLKSTRINRKVYKYPAVVLSDNSKIESSEDGFTKLSLEDFIDSPPGWVRDEWSSVGVSVASGEICKSDCLFAAMAVAAGVVGRVGFYDPNWSCNMLVDSPDVAWQKSTEYLFKIFGANPHVSQIDLVSADEISETRKYVFKHFIDCARCGSKDRSTLTVFRIGLRDKDKRTQGRRCFHNRYIAIGRFLFEIGNGLDVIDRRGQVRNFDISLFSTYNNAMFAQISNERGDDVVEAKHIRELVSDTNERSLVEDAAPGWVIGISMSRD